MRLSIVLFVPKITCIGQVLCAVVEGTVYAHVLLCRGTVTNLFKSQHRLQVDMRLRVMRLVICRIYGAFVCYVYFKAPGKNVAIGEVKGESTSANICYDPSIS